MPFRRFRHRPRRGRFTRDGARLLRGAVRYSHRKLAARLPAAVEGEGSALPKFYWFDAGVLHAAAGGFDQPRPSDWEGVLLEHLVHHEIQSHLHYAGLKGSLGYWATPSGSEVDFVWWRGRDVVAIEVKHGREFRREYRKGIEAFLAGTPAKSYIVYRGERELHIDDTRVLPLETFLRRLHGGEIVG